MARRISVTGKLTEEVFLDSFISRASIPVVYSCVSILLGEKLTVNAFNKLITIVLEANTSNHEGIPDDIQKALDSDADMSTVFNGINVLLLTAIKTRLGDKEFAASIKSFMIPLIYCDCLQQSLLASRLKLENTASSKSGADNGACHLEHIRWRTDVTISTVSLERVFKPSILFQMTLSDGSIKQFECCVEKFQEWRFQTALVLRNMQGLSQHPTFLLNSTTLTDQ